eukprot:PhM_4_TR15711/c0_g1_i1/m.28701
MFIPLQVPCCNDRSISDSGTLPCCTSASTPSRSSQCSADLMGPPPTTTRTTKASSTTTSSSFSSTLYLTHPYFLYFIDTDTERRYCTHMYSHPENGFTAGKIFGTLLVLLCFIVYIAVPSEYTLQEYIRPAFIFLHCTVLSYIIMGCLFLVKSVFVRRYLELFYIVYLSLGTCACTILLYDLAENTRLIIILTSSLTLHLACQARYVWMIFTTPINLFICMCVLQTSFRGTVSHDWAWLPLAILFPHILHRSLELQYRHEFSVVDRSTMQLINIETNTKLMEIMTATFFPPTATKSLLIGTNGGTFRKTALIVADIENFTAWTSRSEPSYVLFVLTKVLSTLEERAIVFGVEKITTAGDSFVGAKFPSNHDDGNDEKAASRADAMIQYALEVSSLNERIAVPVSCRVGVHMGTVCAGFVGSSPPVFDLFGVAIDETKALESKGKVKYVHASEYLINMASKFDNGRSPANDVIKTELGVLFTSRSTITTTQLDSEDNTDEIGRRTLHIPVSATIEQEAQENNNTSNSNPLQPYEVAAIIRRLKRLARFELDEEELEDGEVDPTSTLTTTTNSKNATMILTPHSEVKEQPSSSSLASSSLRQHRLWRYFLDSSVEDSYEEYVTQNTNGLVYTFHNACFVVLVLACALYSLYACMENTRDREVQAITLTLAVIMMSLYQLFPKRSLHLLLTRMLLSWIVLVASSVMFSLMTTECYSDDTTDENGDRELKIHKLHNLVVLVRWLMNLGPVMTLSVNLPIRISIIVLSSALELIQSVLQPFGEDPLLVPLSLFFFLRNAVGLMIMYCVEAAIRNAFVSQWKVNYAMRESGRYMRSVRRAVHVMLPEFAAQKVLEHVKTNMGIITSSRSNNRAAPLFVVGEVLLRSPLVWDQHRLCVAFISVNVSSDDASSVLSVEDAEVLSEQFERLERVISAIELAAARHSVLKIKTVGKTVMLACGMDVSSENAKNRNNKVLDIGESTTRMCRALLSIQKKMTNDTNKFKSVSDDDNKVITLSAAGIHAGGCFGAVLGTTGITFDLFGDTVNTASRVMSSAMMKKTKNNNNNNNNNKTDMSIRLSPFVMECVQGYYSGGEPFCRFSRCPSVYMKGKGWMETYELNGIDLTTTTTEEEKEKDEEEEQIVVEALEIEQK